MQFKLTSNEAKKVTSFVTIFVRIHFPWRYCCVVIVIAVVLLGYCVGVLLCYCVVVLLCYYVVLRFNICV